VSSERIVITGIGAVSPVGLTAPSSFIALIEGTNGVRPLDLQWPDNLGITFGADVKGFCAERLMGAAHRGSPRFVMFALVAAREALQDSGLQHAGYDPRRIATIVGVGKGGVERILMAASDYASHGEQAVDPRLMSTAFPGAAAEAVAQDIGAQGPCYAVVTACASGAHAIGEALQLLRSRAVDAVVCGGAEAVLNACTLALFRRMGALSTANHDPLRASRPFDRDRTGFVMGEGAGVLVVERESAARKRGATIYAELAGYGSSADAFHTTRPSPDGRGPVTSMQRALADARINADDVGYISAHGTSTKANDLMETIAIKSVFGEHAQSLWISSTKSMTGHLIGASGAFELAMSALTIKRGVVPPTINLEVPDPECDLDYVPQTAREMDVRVALKNSFGFGGQNASLVLRAYDRPELVAN
jgi:3-oxoacyl-[acyl-carrier-protein] synthase II